MSGGVPAEPGVGATAPDSQALPGGRWRAVSLSGGGRWDAWLDRDVPPSAALGASVAVLALIALGDYLTGPYLVFATFYLVPVVIAAWYVGRRPALVVAAAAGVVGALSTALDPGEVTAPVYVWNGVFRFVTYAFIAVLVDAERRARAAISAASQTDLMTGLPNRRQFYADAQRELDRARRSDGSVAVAYLDVDDLKARNDTYGHQAGDEMLISFAEVARRCFRSTDLLARLGGDEFCVLLVDADLAEAEAVVDRFVAALARAEPLPIRVSVGLAAGPVPAGVDIEDLVHAADALMYDAKQSGKGRRCTRPTLLAS